MIEPKDRRACRDTLPPWVENPYGLVSLGEIMRYADDEVHLGPWGNFWYAIGALNRADVQMTDSAEAQILGVLDALIPEMRRLGLRVSVEHTENIVKTVEGSDPIGYPRADLHDRIMMLRSALGVEMNATVFLHVGSANADFFREPRKGWEEVTDRFIDTVSDIEEAAKCFALGRYAAAVHHATQVVELGLIELGKFIGVTDPKSGYTAVTNALKKIKDKNWKDKTDFERKHHAFFEQVHGTVEPLQTAWRNKIDHAHGRLIVMTADFSPQVAEEILYATRAFMRRLATEMPS